MAILVSTPRASASLATLNCVGVSPILQQSLGRGKGPRQSVADNAHEFRQVLEGGGTQ